ncbi:MAG: hypothetical protein M0R37_02815 [Bacteroidales bacterium]|nr:hypothetical protein [Bacteroidales bacterium]
MEKPNKFEGINKPLSVEERVKTKLKSIFDEYGYIDEERRKKILGIMVMDYAMGMVMEGDNNFLMNDNYEVAKLIKILRQCKEVVITGVIENPQNDKERKGQATKTKICAEHTLLHLDYFLNTLLEYQQDGFYQYHFKWEFKDEIDNQYNPMDSINFTEPYTKIELEQIIEYEKERHIKKIKNAEKTSRQKIGGRLLFIENNMQNAGLFSTLSEGKTREYAFLFDCFVAIGKIPIPEIEMNNSEKYTFVKDCMKTYKNYQIKLSNI